MDICIRCKKDGEDRRTLWMACWYAMKETGVPFGQIAISGQTLKHLGTEPYKIEGLRGFDRNVWEDPKPDAESHQHDFFTLRVCKDCRAEWMLAIKHWFASEPGSQVQQEADAKVRPGMVTFQGKTPVRVLGSTVSVDVDDRGSLD